LAAASMLPPCAAVERPPTP